MIYSTIEYWPVHLLAVAMVNSPIVLIVDIVDLVAICGDQSSPSALSMESRINQINTMYPLVGKSVRKTQGCTADGFTRVVATRRHIDAGGDTLLP
ncbi:hypothetical protein [Pseudonocardia alaniniphila]|uniref:Uncharacterized protein n=1 Tax=Pseudonocardia alaniniphila TaxID=75291 RepID=A0ABS9TFF3_9PSEU|nr:hypothetical protein [Pseudonocardia alaniniphila]MCH6167143.1 hypothetical protein [Pseudonocardia alaniniphila]